MFDVKHYLLSLAGAVVGFYSLSFLVSGGTAGLIMGAFFGLPLGVFVGILIVELPRIGFKEYHLLGLVGSCFANAGAFFIGEPLLAFAPLGAIILLLLLVTTCLACYGVSERLLTTKEGKAK